MLLAPHNYVQKVGSESSMFVLKCQAFCFLYLALDQFFKFVKLWYSCLCRGWRDGSSVKRALAILLKYPGVVLSWHRAGHNGLELQLQGIWCLLLTSMGTGHITSTKTEHPEEKKWYSKLALVYNVWMKSKGYITYKMPGAQESFSSHDCCSRWCRVCLFV